MKNTKTKELYKVMNTDLLKQKFEVVRNAYSKENHEVKIDLLQVDVKSIESQYGKMPTSLKDLLTNFGAIYIDGHLDDDLDLEMHRIDCRFDESGMDVCANHQEDLADACDEDLEDLTKEDIEEIMEDDYEYGRYITLLKYGYPLTTYYEDFPIFLDTYTNSENPPVVFMSTEGDFEQLSPNLETYINQVIENGCFLWLPDSGPLLEDELEELKLDFSNIEVKEVEAEEQNEANRIALEFIEGASNKFWVVSWDSKTFTVTYGKIGSKGVTKTTISTTTEKDATKLANDKMKKGYKQTDSFDWESIK